MPSSAPSPETRINPAGPAEDRPVVIKARNLTKRFGKRIAVNDVSFTVYQGDVFGFLGPNGAGKTTTIRMLLRLIRRDSGEVELFGQPLDVRPLDLLARIGALVEEPAFYPYLTGRQNLRVFGHLAGSVPEARITDILERVGLADRGDDLVTAYSQGMRQRLGIGQALLTSPELIFLDEPTNGLDLPGIEAMRRLLLRLAHEEHVTICLSSHLLHEIEMLCNRVLILDQGKLLVEGEMRDLLETDTVRLEIGTTDPERARRVVEAQGYAVEGSGSSEDRFVIRCPREDVPALNRALVESGVGVHMLAARRPTLEEYFRDRIGKPTLIPEAIGGER